LEKVWIKGPKPSKVIEKDEVHYFYWPVEIGIGRFQIQKFKIPYFPKLSDYEPVKTVTARDGLQVLTRFHYRILVYFNKPVLVSNKPVVDFMRGSHSPYVYSTPNKMGLNISLEDLDSREISAFLLLVALYDRLAIDKVDLPPGSLETYDVEEDNIPADSLFDLQKFRCIVWVGVFPERENTPEEVMRLIVRNTRKIG